MEELNLSEDDLFDLLDQKSTNKDSMPSKRQVPIEELEYWLKILCENLKGQLISEGLFDVIVSTKKATNFFKDFCPIL